MTTIGLRRLVLPRFGTPRDENRETLGPQVGEVAKRLGSPLMPHQQLVMDVALEHDGTAARPGRFFYDEVDWTIMRQSGKTWGLFTKNTWRATFAPRLLTPEGRLWGPQRIAYTAQTRNAARKKLERDFADALRSSGRSFSEVAHQKVRPTKPTEWKLSLNNGSEHILFGRGNYLQIDAPSKTAGHGDTLDDGNIDEAFAHQTDAVEQSMRPAQATRRNAQLWVTSTAGDENSSYLWQKVKAGRAACESGVPSRVAYFDWSLPDECDIDDEDAWWEFMPALGHTIAPDFVRSELERARRNPDAGGEELWRRAYGNMWVRVPPINDVGSLPIPLDEWNTLEDSGSRIVDARVFALDVSPDRRWASFGVAGLRDDGLTHVEVVKRDQGTGWVVGYAAERCAKWSAQLVVDPSSPAGGLLGDLNAARVPVVEVSQREHAQACGALVDAVRNRRLRHLGQASLLAALSGAEKRQSGDIWLWSRVGSHVDITPLVAVTLALGASIGEGPSVYEDRGVMVLG